MQALPLAQQLEAKPQTGHPSSAEAASVPFAAVTAATVTATSTIVASGQTSGPSTGMCTQVFFINFINDKALSHPF